MIICHPLKLIFVKTAKVGGTSFEIALSRFCGDHDLITPVSSTDERTRSMLGFRSPQNYRRPCWYDEDGNPYATSTWSFKKHSTASQIRDHIPSEIWDTYTKVTIWRNPFDAMVSRYYWERKLKKFKHQNFRDFIHTVATTKMLKNLKIGTINNEFILDKNIQYEKLQDGIEDLGVPGLWDTFKDIRAKSGLRPEGSSTRDMYDAYPETIEIIQKVCALEIEQFGYTLPTHNKP